MSVTEENIYAFLVGKWFEVFEVETDYNLYFNLMQEEFAEWMKAGAQLHENSAEAMENYLKEAADFRWVSLGYAIMLRRFAEETELDTHPDASQAQEAIQMVRLFNELDTMTNSLLGIDPEDHLETFHRVFDSNMSKLGADGKPVRNESGKIMKGPFYEAPNLSDIAAAILA